MFPSRFLALAQGVSRQITSRPPVGGVLGNSISRYFSVKDGGVKNADESKIVEQEFDEEYDEEDLLEGKPTGEILRKSFAERSAAAMRYEYFAQRAELEAEMEASSAFRSLTETAKQQALGFLELLEEYGSHSDEAGSVHIGTTLDNVAASALAERNDVDRYLKHAEQATEDGLDQLAEWFGDMSDASSRTADRLELVSSLMDAEYENMDDSMEEGEDSTTDRPSNPAK